MRKQSWSLRRLPAGARRRSIARDQDRPKNKIAKITRDPLAETVLVGGKDGKRPTVLTTERGAKLFREKLAQAGQEPAADRQVGDREEILALLESGRARETGRVEVAGRDAIRIESPDGRQVYLVDATTYAPIEWMSAGNGGGVTLRFPVYEELPVDTKSMELLDLEAQYPGRTWTGTPTPTAPPTPGSSRSASDRSQTRNGPSCACHGPGGVVVE